MAELVVFEHEDGALVVDSRLIAERLDIQHESFMKTINKYKKEAEQAFGHIRFEIGTVTNSVGAVNEVNFNVCRHFIYLCGSRRFFLLTSLM